MNNDVVIYKLVTVQFCFASYFINGLSKPLAVCIWDFNIAIDDLKREYCDFKNNFQMFVWRLVLVIGGTRLLEGQKREFS